MNFIACDCGNSAIRINLCRYNGQQMTCENVLTEDNKMVHVGGYYYWDMLRIFDVLKAGISLAAKQNKIDGIGICTWGVDFMLFDENGTMLSNALSYRNTLGEEQISKLSDDKRIKMFFDTGILCDRINSVYMIKALQERMPCMMSIADKLLMVPDIFNYFFTGVMENEPSELSTTQLMDVRTQQINKDLCNQMGIKSCLFSSIGRHGYAIGNVLPEHLKNMKIDYDIPVICVPSHDTASAVLGVPTTKEEYAFISAGTWALIGADCPEPIITNGVLAANMTNETGAFGRTTLLKNSIGMFIPQQLKKEYEMQHEHIDWNSFTQLGTQSSQTTLLFNVNDPMFFNPDSMSENIWKYLRGSGKTDGEPNWPDIICATHNSIAASYAVSIADTSKVTGQNYDSVYIVGGGAKNVYINQLFADMSGYDLVACDEECASMGNALAQLSYCKPELKLQDLKRIAVQSLKTVNFSANENKKHMLDQYQSII